MKSYLERFKKMVEELKNHPQIEVKEFVVNPPATDEQIETAQERFNLTPDMLDFYKLANGLKLTWTIKGETDGFDDGYVDLLPVEEVFMDWSESLDTEEFPEFEPLHPFDYFRPEGCAAFYLNEETENPEVYFLNNGSGEMSELKLDFKSYMDLLLETKGFFYWQSARASSLEGNNNFQERNLKTKLPKLFPDINLENIFEN
ncbi:MAG: SMI1/KNR4 family protein [Bacteroidales bacterium]|nr:SMI1/KNR4 family protein [Bacteroidales bacterium]